MKKKFLYFITLLVFYSTPCVAANYYVDVIRGDNSNNGSQGSPWKECPGTQNPTDSSTGGWTTIRPGDTVYFTAGQTWTRPILISSDNFSQPTKESDRITLTSTSSTRAIIDVSGYTTKNYIMWLNRDYITLKYFELRDLSKSGVSYGIYNNGSRYFKILYNYIHDIQDSSGAHSFGLGFDRGGNGEIAYNKVGNVEEKAIELYQCDRTDIHHNTVFTTNSFGQPTDHGVVISGASNTFYNNIIYAEDNVRFRANPSYGMKVDGNAATSSFANSNKVYNNIIYGWPCGLAAMDTHDNEYTNNTIYHRNETVDADSYDNHSLAIRNANNNAFRNNLLYYVGIGHNYGHFGFFDSPSSTCANNTVTDNLFYRTGSDERFRVGGKVGITLSTMEGSATFNGKNGNVMRNNTILAPEFSGGTHHVASLPTGFDSNWLPNDNGLSLTASSPVLDIGYIDASGSTLNPPTGLKVLESQ